MSPKVRDFFLVFLEFSVLLFIAWLDFIIPLLIALHILGNSVWSVVAGLAGTLFVAVPLSVKLVEKLPFRYLK